MICGFLLLQPSSNTPSPLLLLFQKVFLFPTKISITKPVREIKNITLIENQREQLQKNIKESYLKSIGEEEPAMDLGMSFGKDNGENFVKFGGGYHTPKYSIAGFIGNPKQGINAKYYFDKVGISGSLEYDNLENSTIASVGLTYN